MRTTGTPEVDPAGAEGRAGRTRRQLLAGGAGALAVAAVESLGHVSPAAATNGQPVLLGSANSATSATSVSTSSGLGFSATGGGTAQGLQGIGGSTNGIGVIGTGGGLNGNGVKGVGKGVGTGVFGTGGGTNGIGVAGAGGLTDGIGVRGTGAGGGAGVSGAGGANSGPGASGTGGAPNGDGVLATGTGTGSGILATGGAQSGIGVTANGGGPNGSAVRAQAVGIGSGLISTGGSGGGDGIQATGGGTSGIGITATGFWGVGGNASSANGYGVVAQNQHGGFGLLVLGGIVVDNCGLVTIAAGATSATVTPPSPITDLSLVLATVQNVAGVSVKSAAPDPTTGAFTIHLNAAVPAGQSASVAWLVVNLFT
jgi:hypothetical protein